MIQLNAEPGAYRVVEASELFDLTGRGWRLIAVVDKNEVIQVEEPMPPELQPKEVINNQSVRCSQCYSSYHDGVRRWKKPHLVITQRFLVHQAKDDLLTELHAEIRSLRGDVATATEDARAILKAHEEAGKTLVEKVEQLHQTKLALANAEARERTLANTRQKLEGDIAKLRQAIGDLRMKEILEGKA